MSITSAAAAYANAAKIVGPGLAPRGNDNENGSGFADMLKSAATDAVDTIRKGETVSLDAVRGKADITEVVTAVTNAEATIQTVSALRDRVVQAYQEILRMPI